jgi:NADH-quinone oxidoreductase subunit F
VDPLFAQTGEALLERLLASGLRGRGGGWFPAARKWRAVRAEGGQPLVVANGAEGEPGSIKDRALLRRSAADVLHGLALAAHAVGAREGVVFLKRSFAREAESLAAALRAGAAGALPVRIAHGDDSYVAGEETAVVEALEGRRAWPRPKPPLVAAVGFEGRPTLVQNVETLAYVPAALRDPAGFRASEETLVSVWGDVRRPGLGRVRLGTPLGRVIEEVAGGPAEDVRFVFPGGPSAPPLGPEALATPLDPDALRAAGTSLGTAAVLAVGRSRSPTAVGVSLAAFFERESCGQCPPCVMGTGSLHRITAALDRGTARARDHSDLAEIAGFMGMHGYCAHCRAAAASVTRLVGALGLEPDAAAAGRPFDAFGPGSPERAAIEAALDEATA